MSVNKNEESLSHYVPPENAASPKKIWYAPHKLQAYGEEEIKAVEQCLRDGWLAGFGPKTKQFEDEVCTLFGKKYGVFVNSGSSANLLALLVLDLKSDDEIITPACSFSTVVAPIDQLGAKPIFVDVELGTYVPSVQAVLEKLTPKTKAIFLPNLIGSKPDWKALRQAIQATQFEKVLLIEDSCDTITFTNESDIAITSFYASHIITAGGTGGMVMFNDLNLKKKALMYRDWGRIGDNSEDTSTRFAYSIDDIEYDFKFLYGVKGYNFKASEMNAAFGLIQLQKLPNFTSIRRTNFQRFIHNLQNLLENEQLILPIEREPFNWLALPLMSPHRAKLLRYLEKNDVQTRVCFAGNITRHPAYREYLQQFPISDRIMKEGFLLGAHHGMTIEDVDHVCDLIQKFNPDQL
eukprot:TRINITY_DN2180_c1_g1_i1.p1 TRINITY_DN2180_c1_g1~~TRINITY_DN2180_c1_g1_i1.p1  ORF type:complete len:407 (-),score=216.41 TRINITY_DN2180_c1_g1_i1:78-1298(-)